MKEIVLYLYSDTSIDILVKEDVTLPPLGSEGEVVLHGFQESWNYRLQGEDQFRGYMARELRVQWSDVRAVVITEEIERERQDEGKEGREETQGQG